MDARFNGGNLTDGWMIAGFQTRKFHSDMRCAAFTTTHEGCGMPETVNRTKVAPGDLKYTSVQARLTKHFVSTLGIP
jgi:hypothetical protein